jgi:Fe-S-cluster containining protein
VPVTANTTVEEALEIGKTACGSCGHCCEFGSGYLLDEDIRILTNHFGLSNEEFLQKYAEKVKVFNTDGWRLRQVRTKFPAGKCVLYDMERKCTVQEKKPLFCRITTCKKDGGNIVQWFRFKHFVNPDDEHSVREYESVVRHIVPIPGAEAGRKGEQHGKD